MDISGISAIVTGGARVAIFDLNGDTATRVSTEIGGISCVTDVSSEDSVPQALDKVEHEHGTARIVVSCAGIGGAARIVGRDGPMPLEDFENTIRVNFVGTFNVMRFAANRMSILDEINGMGRGVFVNTASFAAFEGQIGQAAYAASKGGIRVDGPASRARICAVRDQGEHDSAGYIPNTSFGNFARRGAKSTSRKCHVSGTSGPTRRIRQYSPVLHRKRISKR